MQNVFKPFLLLALFLNVEIKCDLQIFYLYLILIGQNSFCRLIGYLWSSLILCFCVDVFKTNLKMIFSFKCYIYHNFNSCLNACVASEQH